MDRADLVLLARALVIGLAVTVSAIWLAGTAGLAWRVLWYAAGG